MNTPISSIVLHLRHTCRHVVLRSFRVGVRAESACFIRTVQTMRELHWKLVFRCRLLIKRTPNDHRLPSLTDLFDLAANRKRLANKQQRLE